MAKVAPLVAEYAVRRTSPVCTFADDMLIIEPAFLNMRKHVQIPELALSTQRGTDPNDAFCPTQTGEPTSGLGTAIGSTTGLCQNSSRSDPKAAQYAILTSIEPLLRSGLATSAMSIDSQPIYLIARIVVTLLAVRYVHHH